MTIRTKTVIHPWRQAAIFSVAVGLAYAINTAQGQKMAKPKTMSVDVKEMERNKYRRWAVIL